MQASISARLATVSAPLQTFGPFSASGVTGLPKDCDQTCGSSACGVIITDCAPILSEGDSFAGLGSSPITAKLAAAISVVSVVPNHFISITLPKPPASADFRPLVEGPQLADSRRTICLPKANVHHACMHAGRCCRRCRPRFASRHESNQHDRPLAQAEFLVAVAVAFCKRLSVDHPFSLSRAQARGAVGFGGAEALRPRCLCHPCR